MMLARLPLWDDIWYAIRFLDRVVGLIRSEAILPMDLRLAKVGLVNLFFVGPAHFYPKMLILGTIFQSLGPILTITAVLSSKPVFLGPMDKRDEAAQ